MGLAGARRLGKGLTWCLFRASNPILSWSPPYPNRKGLPVPSMTIILLGDVKSELSQGQAHALVMIKSHSVLRVAGILLV